MLLFLDSFERDWLSECLGSDSFLLPQQPLEKLVLDSASLSSLSTGEQSLVSVSSLSAGEQSPVSVSSFGSPSSTGSSLPDNVFGEPKQAPLQFKILSSLKPSEPQELVLTDYCDAASPQQLVTSKSGSTSSSCQQESTTKSKKSTARKARKRVQNRDAATRYRIKKKSEQGTLDEQVRRLESENKRLEDMLAKKMAERNTLRSLWEEVQGAKRVAFIAS